MKTTPYEWRKATVAGFDAQIAVLQKQATTINTQLQELIQLRHALAKVELKRTNGKHKAQDQPAPAKGKKRKLSPEARKRISDAAKRMHRARKAWKARQVDESR